MSWKKRRQWANSSPDPNLAPWFNLFTVISTVITFLGIPLSQLPIIGPLIALLFVLSLVTTPWLVLMGLASGTWNYGFPTFKEKPKENFIDVLKKESAQKKEEIERQAKLRPFNREEAEKAAKEYHKQKGQFLEIIDEKTKKEIRVKKIKELRKKVRELKRIDKENTKEAKSLEKNPKYSRTPKGNPKENKVHSKFIREVLFPLREKMYAAERELRDAVIIHERNGEPLPEQPYSYGKRGGRYNLRVSKDGNYYRQYF